MSEPVISLKGVRRDFAVGDAIVSALAGVSLDIAHGEMIAITGSSGSGKSTLLNILGCLDRSTSGIYRVAGTDVSQLDVNELAALRREHFGFIFQRYHLLAELTALGMSRCRPSMPASNAADRQARRAMLGAPRHGRAHGTSPEPAVRRPAAARVDRPRADERRDIVILPTSRPARSTSIAAKMCCASSMSSCARAKRSSSSRTIMAVAKRADRIIEISDGVIVSDLATRSDEGQQAPAPSAATSRHQSRSGSSLDLDPIALERRHAWRCCRCARISCVRS
jgi:macrolide transport system ATP-binding/permease protein